MKCLFTGFFFFILLPFYLQAQRNITVDTTGFTVEELVRDVLIQSECAAISNVEFSGKSGQIGYFSSGRDAVDVETGIIISTGRTQDAVGPNERTGTSTDYFDGAHVGDEDLRRVANVGVNDLKDDAILEFDFIPLDDHLEFEFVFASEEYCDFAGPTSPYNDVFGFFLSGPGISGPFTDNAINIAVSPDGNSNITVLNINHNINHEYFIDNTPLNQPLALPEHYQNCRLDMPRDGINSLLERDGSSIETLEYDGYTVILKAESAVIPLQEYHLKIGIADVVDGNWDSAVFLRAGSFRAGQPQASVALPDTLDCVNNTIALNGENSSQGVQFSYSWSTEAGNIVSGSNTLQPLVDQPGRYRLVVNRTGTSCGDTAFVDVIFDDDQPQILRGLSDTLSCLQTAAEITFEMEYLGDYTYQVQYPDGTFSSVSDLPSLQTTNAGWHTLFVTSPNGCEDVITHFVEIDTLTGSVTFQDQQITCSDSVLSIEPDFDHHNRPFEHSWRTPDGRILTDAQNLNIMLDQAGTYILTSTSSSSGCMREDILTITQDTEYPVIDAGNDFTLNCNVNEIGLVGTIMQASGNEFIEWSAAAGSIIKMGLDPLLPIICAPDEYTLAVTGMNGCKSIDRITVSPPDDPPELSLIGFDTLTCNQTTSMIAIAVLGDYVSIEWQTQNGSIIDQLDDGLVLSVDAPGIYSAQVVNADECYSNLIIELPASAPPLAQAGEDILLDCDGLASLSAQHVSANGATSYEWTLLENPSVQVLAPSFTTDQAGTYVLRVYNATTGCVALDSVLVSENLNDVGYVLDFSNCQFDAGSFSVATDRQSDVFEIIYKEATYPPDAIVPVENDPLIQLQLINGCRQTIELDYILNEALVVEIITPDKIFAGVPFDIEARVNRLNHEIESINWITDAAVTCTDCLSQEMVISSPTSIELILTDVFGCQTTTSILLDPIILAKVYIPTAFSPNGDAVNDRLEIFTNEFVERLVSVRIYNRWGSKVFERVTEESWSVDEQRSLHWDGTDRNGNPSPEGMYIYTTEVLASGAVPLVITGEVVLMR